ncbi:hypothetical protein JCM11491_006064 [Sporobolomyces phaffii]
MTRIFVASLLLTSALAARASTLAPRQQSDGAPSLDSAYGAIQTFSSEVIERMSNNECNGDDECDGWLQSALACAEGGGQDEAKLAQCACQDQFQKNFAACVACINTDSAKQTNQAQTLTHRHLSILVDGVAFTSVCSSLGNGNSSSPASSSGTESSSSSATATSGAPSASSSGTATSSSPSGSATGDNAAAPTESAGSGANAGIVDRWTLAGMVGTGLVAAGLIVA